ncbi:nitroreductase family deazaflavin-dependent oxidoreductase [Micromonospora sp. STR1_7]|uniref:Nitroreductase family deazaflavin-dependent oxidoreductase n=1 Tax=Micromonospora parastrephiae TaxID=2806101 RepID=A0ABS1XYD6_9ACTN|nr:nitroreductase family deazaflavin-dependent oxidoreductase [Micromonospora parastrephiae]
MDDAIARALAIGPDSTAAERTIDITTLGARTGAPRRIEIWFHRVDGRWYLTGMPGPRGWYANVRAHPRFTCISSTGSRPTCPRQRCRSTSRHDGG